MRRGAAAEWRSIEANQLHSNSTLLLISLLCIVAAAPGGAPDPTSTTLLPLLLLLLLCHHFCSICAERLDRHGSVIVIDCAHEVTPEEPGRHDSDRRAPRVLDDERRETDRALMVINKKREAAKEEEEERRRGRRRGKRLRKIKNQASVVCKQNGEEGT